MFDCWTLELCLTGSRIVITRVYVTFNACYIADVETWTLPEELVVTDVAGVSPFLYRLFHYDNKAAKKLTRIIVSTEKTTEAKMMKTGGTEIGKTLAEKSRGLFSANDWQCKTYVCIYSSSGVSMHWFNVPVLSFYLDAAMWIGLGDQSATCATLQNMPSLKREQVR